MKINSNSIYGIRTVHISEEFNTFSVNNLAETIDI